MVLYRNRECVSLFIVTLSRLPSLF